MRWEVEVVTWTLDLGTLLGFEVEIYCDGNGWVMLGGSIASRMKDQLVGGVRT